MVLLARIFYVLKIPGEIFTSDSQWYRSSGFSIIRLVKYYSEIVKIFIDVIFNKCLSFSGNHYTWTKVTTTVHNIIVGKLWVDQTGDMTITNHKDGSKCRLSYIPYSYFTRDQQRKVRVENIKNDARCCKYNNDVFTIFALR